MTCIIAYKHGGRVYMAGDKMASGSNNRFKCKLPKIIKHGNVLIGACGSFHLDSILNYRMDILNVHSQDLDKYLHTKFLADLTDQIMHMDYRSEQSGYRIEGDLLIAANNKIYLIEDFASVIDIEADFYACGSGQDYALGAMEILTQNKKMSAKHKLKLAMDAVEKHCPSVGFGMDLITDAES